MKTENRLQQAVAQALKQLYGADVPADTIQVTVTRKDQKGDYTVVVFPLLKISHKKPEETGADIGNYLVANVPDVASAEPIKGFLNLTLSNSFWASVVESADANDDFGYVHPNADSPLVMIEYSSPNTNKPLHLGHVRNNLLGYSLSRILSVCGCKVVKTNIVNDRGIHICKSMLAWQKWGNNATPESLNQKGDHLVGDYYVKFDKAYKAQIKELQEQGLSEEEAEEKSPLMQEAREMLRKWEAEDPEVRALWRKMNEWVYAGFDETYKALGVDFDKIYYESETYKIGKGLVLKGLEEGKFYRRDDGSVWADLSADGLDEKLLLRKDGTSVYMTQDIGTARLRYDEYPIDKMVYVVGNEQNYHFQVLSILLDRLGFKWGKSLVHFSYGMVELPNGRMKSREGTVVDADDLVASMVDTAREMSESVGKLDGLTADEAAEVHRILGLGALKYFLLKVDPRKNMTFNPAESIDFNGNTGPFVQYSYARTQSVLRKAAEAGVNVPERLVPEALDVKELEVIKLIEQLPIVIEQAGKEFSPALVANYAFEMAKAFNQFYHDCPILREEDKSKQANRLLLCKVVAKVIKNALWTLGIQVPARM
ncbi:MAG: arginine--tRNA ligase [Bacteroidales bacterium]|nr:arginine--tRNA ligase [Bacteroidales bacterium]MDD7725078.1 arginine--tRNA ligase [Bacteroidales bacterium]